MVGDLRVECPISNSDHNLLSWVLRCNAKVSKNIKMMHSYKRGDYLAIAQLLDDVNWKKEFGDKSLQENSSFLTAKLHEGIDKHVPLRKISKRRFPPWVSKKILKVLQKGTKPGNGSANHQTATIDRGIKSYEIRLPKC